MRPPPSQGRNASNLRRAQEILQVEAPGVHGEAAFGIARPVLLRAIPIELDAVLVRVAQIERLGDAVVARAVKPYTGLNEAAQRIGQPRGVG